MNSTTETDFKKKVSQQLASWQSDHPQCLLSARLVSEKTTYIVWRNGQFANHSVQKDLGVMLECFLDGFLFYGAASGWSQSSLQLAYQRVMHQLPWKKNHLTTFPESVRPRGSGQYQSPREKSVGSVPTELIHESLAGMSSYLKNQKNIIQSNAMAMFVELETDLLSARDKAIYQNFELMAISQSCIAQTNGETQMRSAYGGLAFCQQAGFEALLKEQDHQKLQQVADQAYELTLSPDCPEKTTTLILAPDQMTLQIHESIGHPLEYDRILGDERNYAGWSFVKPEDFGTLQFGSEKMNVTFDPTVPGEYASYAFDDVGNTAEKKYLIKDGKLIRGLGSLESQHRMGRDGVANSRASSWNRAPIDRMANINLEAGSKSLAQMIAETEDGIIMQANKSWSIDDYRNKFQFGCEYAQQIKNGKIVGTYKNPNYRGTTVKFWNQLTDVSQELEIYGSPFCGKGEPNQVIRVGHRSPYSKFENVEVFGG